MPQNESRFVLGTQDSPVEGFCPDSNLRLWYGAIRSGIRSTEMLTNTEFASTAERVHGQSLHFPVDFFLLEIRLSRGKTERKTNPMVWQLPFGLPKHSPGGASRF